MSNEKLERATTQLVCDLNAHLVTSVILGCLARDLWLSGDEDKANEIIEGGEPMVKLLMEAAHELETRIRNGSPFHKALDEMRQAGWLKRISNLEMGE